MLDHVMADIEEWLEEIRSDLLKEQERLVERYVFDFEVLSDIPTADPSEIPLEIKN